MCRKKQRGKLMQEWSKKCIVLDMVKTGQSKLKTFTKTGVLVKEIQNCQQEEKMSWDVRSRIATK